MLFWGHTLCDCVIFYRLISFSIESTVASLSCTYLKPLQERLGAIDCISDYYSALSLCVSGTKLQ